MQTRQYSHQFEKQYQKHLKRAVNKQQSMKKMVRDLCISQTLSNWLILSQIIEHFQSLPDKQQFNLFIYQIKPFLNFQQTSLPIKLFLYNYFHSKSISIKHMSWNIQLNQMINTGKLMMFTSWISQSEQFDQLEVIETINMVAEVIIIMMEKQFVKLEKFIIEFIIYLICFIEVDCQKNVKVVKGLCEIVRKYKTASYRFIFKEQVNKQSHQIMKIIIDIVSKNTKCRGNINMLFTLNILTQKQIKQFIQFNTSQFFKLSDQHLTTFFKTLLNPSFQPSILILLCEWSNILKQNQNYFQLAALYKSIILPIVIYKGKTCKHALEIIIDIGSWYVIGFYQTYNIGKNGLIALIKNVNQIQNRLIKEKWIKLALLVADKQIEENQLIDFLYNQLESQGINNKQVDKLNRQKQFDLFLPHTMWQVQKRRLKKLKQYKKYPSKLYQGIQNKGSQCYIIVILQSLFTTQILPNLFKKCKLFRTNQFCYQLNYFFGCLQVQNDSLIRITDIKRSGPAQFNTSKTQQDTQQYLLKLFQKIQEQLKNTRLVQLFEQLQKTMKILTIRKIKCEKCQMIKQHVENYYVYSISHLSSLTQFNTQKLQDYKCEKCRSNSIISTIQLRPSCQIFFVHINRFSFSHNVGRKQLYSSKIQRNFLNYQLTGIIFHIGQNISSGHYVYYYKINKKRWVEMDDNRIEEIQLDQDDEQFEKQMKLFYTPYILIYQIKDQAK